MEYFRVPVVWGLFTFFLQSQWPDRAPVGMWGQCKVTNKEHKPAVCGTWRTIPLKGEAGANQSSSLPSQDIPRIHCLLEVWALASVNSSPPPKPTHRPPQKITIWPHSCLVCFWPSFLLTHATPLARHHRQIPSDSSLTRSLRRRLRLQSPPPVTHFSAHIYTCSETTTFRNLERWC